MNRGIVSVAVFCLWLGSVSACFADTRLEFVKLVCEDMMKDWEAEKCRCIFDKSISLLSDEQMGVLQMAVDSSKNQKNMTREQKKLDNEFHLKHYGELIEQIQTTFESEKDNIMKQCEMKDK